jgi:Arylsulfatase A and related enzymes
MTGKHSGHGRIRGNTRMDLQPEDVTVPKLLKQAGYRTALIGKWGLGTAGHVGIPNKQGFDEFFGYLDQRHAHSYYPTHLWENDYEFFLPGNFGNKRVQYTHDLFTQRAMSFLDAQSQTQPFFLYLPTPFRTPIMSSPRNPAMARRSRATRPTAIRIGRSRTRISPP